LPITSSVYHQYNQSFLKFKHHFDHITLTNSWQIPGQTNYKFSYDRFWWVWPWRYCGRVRTEYSDKNNFWFGHSHIVRFEWIRMFRIHNQTSKWTNRIKWFWFFEQKQPISWKQCCRKFKAVEKYHNKYTRKTNKQIENKEKRIPNDTKKVRLLDYSSWGHLVVIILQPFWNWRNLETIKRHRRSSSSRHFVRSLIAAMTNGFSNCSRKKNQNNGTQNGPDHRRHSDSEEDSAQDSFGNNFKSNMKIRNVFEKMYFLVAYFFLVTCIKTFQLSQGH